MVMGFEGLGGVGGVVFGGFCMSFFVSPDLNCKTDQCRITLNTGHHYVIWSRKC